MASSTSRVLHVLDVGAGGQAVLRQADAAVLQIVANLLVLHAVEAVLFEQFGQALLPAVLRLQPRQQAVKQGLHHAAPIPGRVRQAAPNLSSSARAAGVQRLRVRAQPARDVQRVIAARQQRLRRRAADRPRCRAR